MANADQTARPAPGGPPSLVNQTLGQFQIKEELGRGGMAVVYKGYQPSLDRWVAIKTLPTEMSKDRDMVSRFHREAEAMVALNHSNIVQIIDKGQDQGLYYFAMEFVEGPSLKDLLKQESMSMDLLFDICVQVSDGLAYAHKKGIVHRDIKPANILYEKTTGLAKVADFGIARVTNKEMDMITLTAQNVGMGTMNYMAPEQKTDAKAVDHRADIYSLGVMIYEMFTGKLPLGRFKLPSQMNSKLPRKLDEVLAKCLETDPADRYPTMEALRADLQLAREAGKGGGTIVRSVRDAAERTLTAMAGGGGGKGKLFACCFVFVLMFAGAGAGFVFVDPLKLDLLALKKGTTTSEQPPTTTSEQPPTTTSEKPPTTTSENPPTTTSEKPPTTTSERPPTTTSERPPTTTSERPPTTTSERLPTTTEATAVKRLTNDQLGRYNDAAAELERELPAFEQAAKRVGLTSLDAAVADAQAASAAAARQRDEGSADAVGTLERARDGLRRAAEGDFRALVAQLVRTIRDGGGDRATLETINRDYARLDDKPAHEKALGWADVVARLQQVRLDRLMRDAEAALELASIRGDEGGVAPRRARLVAAASLQPSAALPVVEALRAELIALEGPTPRGVREVARALVGVVTGGGTAQPNFYSISPAPGGAVAALGKKTLFICSVEGGQLTSRQVPVPELSSPRHVATGGSDTFWIAEFKGTSVHRFRLSGARLARVGDPVEAGAEIFDLDVGPDGTLYVATHRDVRAYREGVQVGAATPIDREFNDSINLPRRLAALVGGGFVITGHVATDPPGTNVWDAERNNSWSMTVRALLPGDTSLRQYQPRGRNLSGVAPCAGGFLASQHSAQGGDLFFVSSALESNPSGLVREGGKVDVAQDLAVSGRMVYVLEMQSVDFHGFRRRLVAYEMVE